jgi:lysophospholipase L1-like esterase
MIRTPYARNSATALLAALLATHVTAGEARAEADQIRVPKLIAKLSAGEKVTIVALGDSNTEQTFHTRGQMGWPYLLQAALYEKYGANKVFMINAGFSGTGAQQGLKRLDEDVLRFAPDLVIICFWSGQNDALRKIATRLQEEKVEVLLRTPNPVVVPNMPRVNPPVACGKEWAGQSKAKVADTIVKLGAELGVPVVDHYRLWMAADAAHKGPPATNPNKLWMRMSDAYHPGPLGHLAFYRELAPAFGLPTKLSWEF